MSKSTTTPLRVVRKVWARVPSIPIEDIAEAPSRANENSVPLNPLEQLHNTIDACRKCETSIPNLCKPIRMFRGAPGSVMVVGQGPGKKERALGYAFAGRSGKRLDEWLRKCRKRGAARDGIYFTSVVKCVKRSDDELEIMTRNCRPYLIQQISLIRPRLIIALGRLAFETLNFTSLQFAEALCVPLRTREHLLFSPFDYDFTLLAWPHPSGLNRWLNKEKNRTALEKSFEIVATFIG